MLRRWLFLGGRQSFPKINNEWSQLPAAKRLEDPNQDQRQGAGAQPATPPLLHHVGAWLAPCRSPSVRDPLPPGSSKFFFGISVWERPPLNLPPAGLPQKASHWTPHTRPILTVTSAQRPWMLHPVGPTTQPPGHLPALLACRPPEAVSLPFKVPGAGPTCIKVF